MISCRIQIMVGVLATGVNILELPLCREKQKSCVEGKRVGLSDSTALHTRSRSFLISCVIFEIAPILVNSFRRPLIVCSCYFAISIRIHPQ